MDLYRSRLVLVGDELVPASIAVSKTDGKIKEVIIGDSLDTSNYFNVIDFGGLVLMPGIIDSHVHVNEPGRTEWEGYSTATSAAAAGGITTIVDMPLNSIPPTTTKDNFRTKLEAAEGKCFVDVGFWGGVVPGNVCQLKDLIKMGVAGFKCFLIESGVDEFPCVSKDEVLEALDELKGTGSVLLFHAELESQGENQPGKDSDPRTYSTYLTTRPSSMEDAAVNMVISACEEKSVRCHIVHLGSGGAVDSLRRAKLDKDLPITAETCHHYLSLSAEDVPDLATEFKCCPPIRTVEHQEALWEALKSGIVSMVVSDHAPCTGDLKGGDFLQAWGGISSIQLGLSLFWTSARKRGFSISDVNRFLTLEPAKLAGLENSKGKIEVGYDADFVVWDPNECFRVEIVDLEHKNKLSPYIGMSLAGRVKRTVVRGNTVFEEKRGVVSKPKGAKILGGKVSC